MQRLVQLTDEAVRAIRARAENTFRQTGVRRPDGSWDVPFEADTIDRLTAEAIAGETLSDTIVRICSVSGRAVH